MLQRSRSHFLARNSRRLSSSHFTSSLLSPGPNQKVTMSIFDSNTICLARTNRVGTYHQPNVPKYSETPSTPQFPVAYSGLRSRSLRALCTSLSAYRHSATAGLQPTHTKIKISFGRHNQSFCPDPLHRLPEIPIIRFLFRHVPRLPRIQHREHVLRI